jgi:hypothetical protein
MEDPIRISLAPRTMVALWLGAVPPLAAGLATGGLAAAVGGMFEVACPLLVALSLRWPVRAPRLFPLYFATLFVVALVAFPFNSLAFITDSWSALLLSVVTMAEAHPGEIDAGGVVGAPRSRRRATPDPIPSPARG